MLQQYWYWWGVFLYLIEGFGNNVEFVFKDTLSDGLHIGVQWKFESEKTQVSLGKGFSFSITHSYKGKAMIRNADTFIEPLLHLLPLRLQE
ncbi:hypothetical protein K1719_005550 [Acacia pycnantha]|nr:hypothetical protein K1719_005550 [Acacia pycnantha]